MNFRAFCIASLVVLAYGPLTSTASSAGRQQQNKDKPIQTVGQAFIYAVHIETVARDGITKNVEIELVQAKRGALVRHVTSLPDNGFALSHAEEPASTPGAPLPNLDRRLLVPRFFPGDRGIRVKVNPEVGFTEILSLKILDPVVLSIAEDGTVLADRENVRAVIHQGSVEFTDCFHALAEESPGTFNVSSLMAPQREADGSWTWTPGEKLICNVKMKGKDGQALVSRQVTVGTRTFIAFTTPVP